MTRTCDALVAGLGEVGTPLSEILSSAHDVAYLDVFREPDADRARFLHVCYPFQLPDFVGTTKAYVDRFRPEVVMIHSTVRPGTTAAVEEACGTPSFYSPVRGKHRNMKQHMLEYRKFLAGPDDHFEAGREHLEAAGLKVERMHPPAALEVAKLLETTYFGVLIGWAQEADRFARAVGTDYETVVRFVDEVEFLPSGYFPGVIAGHCVMPNIEILRQLRDSELLDAVDRSNQERAREEGSG